MYIFLIILAIFVISIIIEFNILVKLRNNVDKSKSGIDVYLQQRFNLIPNLIEVTKAYVNYEQETLERITKLRAIYNESKDIQATNELNAQYKNIMLVSENYPELKADKQFLKLQRTLVKIESQLQAARRIYNYDVNKYNTRISIFPNNLVAKMFNFKSRDLFELGGEENIVVDFQK